MILALALGLGMLLGYLVYLFLQAARRRQEQLIHLRELLVQIEPATATFASYLRHETGYFNQYKRQEWGTLYKEIAEQVRNLPYTASALPQPQKETIRAFLHYHEQGEALRQAYNKEFIPRELVAYTQFFSAIEGRSLDQQQRTAIVSDEDNSLVIAGAGSGKTTTIVGKVAYLQHRYRIPPSHILLISFTSKSAVQLAERINTKGLEPRTFHKFGKDVICAVEGKQPSLFDQNQFNNLIKGYFKDLIANDKHYAELVTNYFRYDLKPSKPIAEFANQGEYIQHLKDNNFRAYKQVAMPKKANAPLTFRQEVVKSVEECHIANFLLFNGIEYEYEASYEHATASSQYAQWKPDFTIHQDGRRIYLEHFGIDREGNVPAFFVKNNEPLIAARQRYWDKIHFARTTSQRYHTVLLESYSYEANERTLLTNLADNLTRQGISLFPKTPAEIWAIIEQAAEQEVGSFLTLLQTFITLLKSNAYTLEEVRRKIEAKPNKERNNNFLSIITPLYTRYEAELQRRGELDFSDLISKAATYLRRGLYPQRVEYIIIDEFQDLSKGRYELLRAIRAHNPGCKLFGVGDDWQSIYRFAGSDIALFKDFTQYFGHSVHANIETTYRFHEPLISRSGEFITRNPNQTRKVLKGVGEGKQTTYEIAYTQDGESDADALRRILDGLGDEIKDKSILLLGRYTFDRDRLRNAEGFSYNQTTDTLTYNHTLFPFLTVHKAKGLEAEIIILLNCSSGRFGFPAEMSDDPVLGLVLSEADQFENGEERRLFYVALTRAKEKVILLTNPMVKSKFISELELSNTLLTGQKKCPVCISADLVKRSGVKNGRPWAFYGCANYLYGCQHQEWV